MAKLGEIFNLQITGEWGNDCSENETGTKVLRTTNFTPEGKLNYDNVVNRNISDKKILEKKLQYGDIILEKSGGTEKNPVGRVVFCDEQINNDIFLCNNFTQAMRTNSNIACPKYIFYFMWFLHFSGKTDLLQNKTTGIRNLQLKSYLNVEIPFPPLEEQQKIAAILDKVTDLIDKRKQQLTKLDELIKSRFVEMFGDPVTNEKKWDKEQLKNLTIKIGSGSTPKGGKESYHIEGISLIRSLNVHNGKFEYKDLAYIDEIQAKQLNNVIVEEQDVLLNITGASVARSCVVPKDVLPARVNQHVTIIRCKIEQLNPIFLNQQLLNASYQNFLIFLGESNGATRQALTKEQIENFYIIIPPLDLQNQFAEFVEQTEKTKVAINHSLDKLETLKKALMQKYFG